ncbi:hypothetical protein [Erwinia phage COW86c]
MIKKLTRKFLMSIERKDYELEDEVDESSSPFNYKSAEDAGYGKTWGLQKMVPPTGQIFKLRKVE